MYIGIYRNRPEINAVIYTHQPCAGIFPTIGELVPVVSNEVMLHTGGRIEIETYVLS